MTKRILLSAILLLQAQAEAALTIASASATNRLECGTLGSNNFNPVTVVMWVNMVTINNQRTFWSKTASGGVRRVVRLSGTGGDVQVLVNRTVQLSYITNTTPFASTGTWVFLAVNIDTSAAAGQRANVWTGTLTALATEATYGTATDGSGTPTSVTADPFWIGNINGASQALQGTVASVRVYASTLTLAQVQSLQFNSIGPLTRLGHWQLGYSGVGNQPDYSGNLSTCTNSGAVLANDPPLSRPFAFLRWLVNPYLALLASTKVPLAS